MTTPLWCLIFVAAIPYILAVSSTTVKISTFGKLDNHHPRKQAENLTGFGHRLLAAQMNGWENVAFFTVIVLVCHLSGADAERSAWAAIAFATSRVIYTGCYLANLATARSLTSFAGLGVCIYMLYLATIAS